MPGDEDDIDVDAMLQDLALSDRDERVRKLEEAGASYDSGARIYSLKGKAYDEDGNPL